MFDTLTVSQTLVEDASKFFELAKVIANTNFLTIPINVSLERGMFSNSFPVWFDTGKDYSVAQHIILYFERALWI